MSPKYDIPSEYIKRALGSWIRKEVEDTPHQPHKWLYELLQNSDDAGSSRVKIVLRDCELWYANNGKVFDRDDYLGICVTALSSKKDDPHAIGLFGIGFLAVHSICRTPEIFSGDYRFGLVRSGEDVEGYMKPIKIKPSGDVAKMLLEFEKQGFRTVFRFPLQKDQRERVKNELQEFQELHGHALLFTNHLRELTIALDSSNETIMKLELGENIWALSRGNRQERFLALEKVVPEAVSKCGSKLKNRSLITIVKVAFPLEPEAQTPSHCIFSYFPLEENLGLFSLPFIINGYFIVDKERRYLLNDEPEAKEYNSCLVDAALSLYADEGIENLKRLKGKNVVQYTKIQWHQEPSYSRNDSPREAFWRQKLSQVIDKVMSKEVVSCSRGKWTTLGNALVGETEEVNSILTMIGPPPFVCDSSVSKQWKEVIQCSSKFGTDRRERIVRATDLMNYFSQVSNTQKIEYCKRFYRLLASLHSNEGPNIIEWIVKNGRIFYSAERELVTREGLFMEGEKAPLNEELLKFARDFSLTIKLLHPELERDVEIRTILKEKFGVGVLTDLSLFRKLKEHVGLTLGFRALQENEKNLLIEFTLWTFNNWQNLGIKELDLLGFPLLTQNGRVVYLGDSADNEVFLTSNYGGLEEMDELLRHLNGCDSGCAHGISEAYLARLRGDGARFADFLRLVGVKKTLPVEDCTPSLRFLKRFHEEARKQNCAGRVAEPENHDLRPDKVNFIRFLERLLKKAEQSSGEEISRILLRYLARTLRVCEDYRKPYKPNKQKFRCERHASCEGFEMVLEKGYFLEALSSGYKWLYTKNGMKAPAEIRSFAEIEALVGPDLQAEAKDLMKILNPNPQIWDQKADIIERMIEGIKEQLGKIPEDKIEEAKSVLEAAIKKLSAIVLPLPPRGSSEFWKKAETVVKTHYTQNGYELKEKHPYGADFMFVFKSNKEEVYVEVKSGEDFELRKTQIEQLVRQEGRYHLAIVLWAQKIMVIIENPMKVVGEVPLMVSKKWVEEILEKAREKKEIAKIEPIEAEGDVKE